MRSSMESQLKDHLFEWFLAQCLAGKAHAKIKTARSPMRRKASAPIRADLKNIFLNYDDQAQLSLADVKPTGFFIKSNG